MSGGGFEYVGFPLFPETGEHSFKKDTKSHNGGNFHQNKRSFRDGMTFFNDLGAKKQGCKNTAPKNFNHIFIEKPSTNFNNLEVTLISEFVNAIFFLVNVAKSTLNDDANNPLTSEKHLQDNFKTIFYRLLPAPPAG
ncbi:hypothetical protein EGT74_07400 [Chitinophaga lutea]|uniref:Uncharacterized protein n=1 Tax=Chitinophaga lutea TaxID=2488634 RepID=A0A3N4Q174_9BACT|nr:hypothetical protein EGT74_07400 [Chitinophaga lutea]